MTDHEILALVGGFFAGFGAAFVFVLGWLRAATRKVRAIAADMTVVLETQVKVTDALDLRTGTIENMGIDLAKVSKSFSKFVKEYNRG